MSRPKKLKGCGKQAGQFEASGKTWRILDCDPETCTDIGPSEDGNYVWACTDSLTGFIHIDKSAGEARPALLCHELIHVCYDGTNVQLQASMFKCKLKDCGLVEENIAGYLGPVLGHILRQLGLSL